MEFGGDSPNSAIFFEISNFLTLPSTESRGLTVSIDVLINGQTVQGTSKNFKFFKREPSAYPVPTIKPQNPKETLGSMNGGIVINVPSHTNLKDIPFEGVLRIYSPLWVDGIPIDNLLDKTEYYLMNAFSECTSSELVINSENYMSDAVGDYLAFYTLRYKLPASAKLESTGFTITCSKVRMPTYRQASVKFMLEFTSQIS